MNLLEIRTRVRKRLGDNSSAFWSDTELNSYINEALKDISFRTKSIKANGYITSISCESNDDSAKSNEYTLSDYFANLYSVEKLYFMKDGTDWIKLDPVITDDLDEDYPGWRSNIGYSVTDTDTGDTTYNYDSNTSIPQKYYWSREEDTLGVNPPPNDDNAGANYMRVYYSNAHVDLTSDSEDPQLPEPLHPAAVNYAVASGCEDRGFGDKANDNWNKYFAKIKDYKIELGRERTDEELMSKTMEK